MMNKYNGKSHVENIDSATFLDLVFFMCFNCEFNGLTQHCTNPITRIGKPKPLHDY